MFDTQLTKAAIVIAAAVRSSQDRMVEVNPVDQGLSGNDGPDLTQRVQQELGSGQFHVHTNQAGRVVVRRLS